MRTHDEEIELLRKICQQNTRTIVGLKAANKKLRAELDDAGKTGKTTAMAYTVARAEMLTWREAHRQLAEARE